jgi:hypothetical protein
MENVDKLINVLLEAEEEEKVAWGKQLLAAERYDFGKYEASFPVFKSGHAVFESLAKEHENFEIPSANCLFYCNDFLFYHSVIKEDGTIEGRAAIVTDGDGQGACFSFWPVYLTVDYRAGKFGGKSFLGYKKKIKERRGKQYIGQLYLYLSDFLFTLNKHPTLVKKVIKDSYTLMEISVITGVPVSKLKEESKRDHWERKVE